MKDNEIIKALECCMKTEFISDCAKCEMLASDCKDTLIENALDLINRQKAEIESLKHRKTELQIRNQELQHEKSEAIKEFAERLCNGRVSNDPVVIAVKVELERMKEMPTADVAEVRRGKWDSNGEFHQCSVCTNFASYDYDYCPYCGAEMTEVEE